jgi:NADPH2:quinone reductase
MRAVQLADILTTPTVVDIERPVLRPGTLRVSIRACGLNFADLLMQKGIYQDTPKPPFTMGMEISGIVTEVSIEITEFQVGDRVMIFCGRDGLAEEGVFDAACAIRIPDPMTFEDAAAFPIAYGTAHLALGHRANLQRGEKLLVTGAAGGAGRTAVELGKLMGAQVIAHARGAEKLEVAKAAGADHIIDDSWDIRAELKALGGVDVVYDTVGGAAFEAAFSACKPEGRLLTIGFASGDVPQILANHLLVKNLTVIGLYLTPYLSLRPEVFGNSLTTLIRWYENGQLKPHISHVLPLEQTLDGFELLRSRQATGKVVIVP